MIFVKQTSVFFKNLLCRKSRLAIRILEKLWGLENVEEHFERSVCKDPSENDYILQPKAKGSPKEGRHGRPANKSVGRALVKSSRMNENLFYPSNEINLF